MLLHVKEELIVLDAIDEYENKEISYVAYEKTMRLPSGTLIKCNVLIELYEKNYNT